MRHRHMTGLRMVARTAYRPGYGAKLIDRAEPVGRQYLSEAHGRRRRYERPALIESGRCRKPPTRCPQPPTQAVQPDIRDLRDHPFVHPAVEVDDRRRPTTSADTKLSA